MIYLDSSAVVKMVRVERESRALITWLNEQSSQPLIASALVEIEVPRALRRSQPSALAAVESGNVDTGFVYKTDADISKKVKIAFSVPIEKGPAIRYPIALVKDTKNKAAANNFLRHLQSDDARKLFERYGFIVKF